MRINLERVEIFDERFYSYVTELKNLASRVDELEQKMAKDSLGKNATQNIKKALKKLHGRIEDERFYLNDLANALEKTTIKYRNIEADIVGNLTQGNKDFYADVNKKNNSVDADAAKKKTKDTYKKSLVQYGPDLKEKLKTSADWYIKHVGTYQAAGRGRRKSYGNPNDPIGTCGDDCTGFACSYMRSVANTSNIPDSYSEAMHVLNGSFAKQAAKAGWKQYTVAELGGLKNLKPGDVLVAFKANDPHADLLPDGTHKNSHHAEIYLGPKQTFGWGKVQKSYPKNNVVHDEKNAVWDNGHTYDIVYRYEGN